MLKVLMGFPGSAVVKNLPAIAGDRRDVGLIPGSKRSSGGGHSNPLQEKTTSIVKSLKITM